MYSIGMAWGKGYDGAEHKRTSSDDHREGTKKPLETTVLGAISGCVAINMAWRGIHPSRDSNRVGHGIVGHRIEGYVLIRVAYRCA